MGIQLKQVIAISMTFATFCGAFAQSTVGELLEKGGRQTTKEDFLARLPIKLKWEWPSRQGEEELVLSADGKISGTAYHYKSKTTSPAEGIWKVEEDGKICAPKNFTSWGSSSNLCWYGFEIGSDSFASLKNEPSSKLLRFANIEKLPNEAKP